MSHDGDLPPPTSTPLNPAEGIRNLPILGFEISTAGREEMVQRILSNVDDSVAARSVIALNPAKVTFASEDPKVHAALTRADFLYPDGIGICLAALLLHRRVVRRLPGVDLAEHLLAEALRRGMSVFLFGGTEVANYRAKSYIVERYGPETRVHGHHGFTDDDEYVLEAVRRANAQVVLVGLGSPTQELWMTRYAERLPGAVLMGVGGSLDVFAGTARRASRLARWTAMEWLSRIVGSPQRMRRFMRTHPPFVAKLLREMSRNS